MFYLNMQFGSNKNGHVVKQRKFGLNVSDFFFRLNMLGSTIIIMYIVLFVNRDNFAYFLLVFSHL